MPILIAPPFAPGSYARILETCGGSPAAAFKAIGGEITLRYFRQIGMMPPGPAYIATLWGAIWTAVHGEGLPKPIAQNETGQAATLDPSYLATLTDIVLSDLPQHRTADELRVLCIQIFTALLSPEFRSCRQSYQDLDGAGRCARQAADHCKDRVSGSHCEDCPFFVALSPEQHSKLLGRSFPAEMQAVWSANTSLFLPEDFRALRIFWHLHLRNTPALA